MFNFFKKSREEMKKEIKGKTKFGEPILICPRCNKGMDKIKKHEIIIDTCRKCNGLWLDDKEIEKIIEAAHNAANKDKAFKKKK